MLLSGCVEAVCKDTMQPVSLTLLIEIMLRAQPTDSVGDSSKCK